MCKHEGDCNFCKYEKLNPDIPPCSKCEATEFFDLFECAVCKVNLYCVSPNTDYGYFVFASSRGKAKSLCVGYNSPNEEYLDFRINLMAKDVGGENNVVVDDYLDKNYKRVLATGNYYSEEDNHE